MRNNRTSLAVSSTQSIGIVCVIGAWLCFSVQDAAVKWLSDGYALHQITLIRSLIGMTITLLVFMPLEGGYRLLKTRQPILQVSRGVLIVCSKLFYFAGLVVLTLGEAAALFFVAPLLITLLSMRFLAEKVGMRRIIAVIVGFVGVLVIVRPTTNGVALASILPLMAALCYASAQILARKMGQRESASTMAFYIQLVFVLISLTVGLSVGNGRLYGTGNASLDFLLQAWHWPLTADLLLFLLIGLLSGAGGYLISQGYRLCEAGIAAPFEYVALPMAVMWSIVIWGEWPALLSWFGILLIMGSGIYVFYRESIHSQRLTRRALQKSTSP